ncbi:hypothetical protein JOD43_003586 [Pullulanibacillus pueri]|uniref:Uncharacterized protein n=1 Tax=Pullulanibacillus pueri TaxID=1437324 RepID=A0A8J2ZZ81_9BACL|nr:hypothetical protein [Pullulanibacillus pueri]MBM7683406.1 hypothetical protein [Pullulanibacillus pueri]GGH88033.1 hypothetical protein GCM10007096_39420 [Pullulanibacillus pueri]
MDKKIRAEKDLQHEGRQEYYLDIDRMMSEGLAGGTVNPKYDHPSVDYYHEIAVTEDPPRET